MPRYFHNLSSVYSFMKLALKNDTVAIHLPPIRNPMYKLDEAKLFYNAPMPKNCLGLVLTEVSTGNKLMELILSPKEEVNMLVVHNFYIRDQVFTSFAKSKILSTIFFKFLDRFAVASGLQKISVVLPKKGFREYNMEQHEYKMVWIINNFLCAEKRFPRNYNKF